MRFDQHSESPSQLVESQLPIAPLTHKGGAPGELLMNILGWKPHHFVRPPASPDDLLWKNDPGAASEEETLP